MIICEHNNNFILCLICIMLLAPADSCVSWEPSVERRSPNQTKHRTCSLVNILSIGFLEPWRLSGPSASTLLRHRKPLWSPFSVAGQANKRKMPRSSSVAPHPYRKTTRDCKPQEVILLQGWRLRPAEGLITEHDNCLFFGKWNSLTGIFIYQLELYNVNIWMSYY